MAEKNAGRETMTASEDNRSDKRLACKIPIPVHISAFNSSHSTEALLVDHCMKGACIVSDQSFLPGSPIIFKVAYSDVEGAGNSDLEILPSMSIGEVKWCRKLPAESPSIFGVGIQHYPPVY
jgi:hypothetical protein